MNTFIINDKKTSKEVARYDFKSDTNFVYSLNRYREAIDCTCPVSERTGLDQLYSTLLNLTKDSTMIVKTDDTTLFVVDFIAGQTTISFIVSTETQTVKLNIYRGL